MLPVSVYSDIWMMSDLYRTRKPEANQGISFDSVDNIEKQNNYYKC